MSDQGSASIEIDASADEVLDVVCDIEAYPDWMSSFREARVLERDSKGRPKLAEFEVDAMIKTVRYVLSYSYPKNGIAWEKQSGDVKEINGSYSIDESGDATKVTYEYSIDPGFPVPGFLRRQGVKMMVSGALGDLKKRVESL